MKDLINVVSDGKTNYFICKNGTPIKTNSELGRYISRQISISGINEGVLVYMPKEKDKDHVLSGKEMLDDAGF